MAQFCNVGGQENKKLHCLLLIREKLQAAIGETL